MVLFLAFLVMHIHQITGYIQQIYLVEYTDKLLLLDGCCRCDVAILQQFITQTLQRPLTDLKLVLVTHMHPDHAGAAHQLRKLTGCQIASANAATQWYAGVSGLLTFVGDFLLAHYMAKRLGKPKVNLWYSPFLQADYLLNSGDTLPYFSEWQVLTTSGHTDRDLTAYHANTQTAYVADLIIKLKHKYVAPFPVVNPNAYQQSLKLIQNLAPQRLLLAHGGEVSLAAVDYTNLLTNAPTKPKTIRQYIKQVWGAKIRQHREKN